MGGEGRLIIKVQQDPSSCGIAQCWIPVSRQAGSPRRALIILTGAAKLARFNLSLDLQFWDDRDNTTNMKKKGERD